MAVTLAISAVLAYFLGSLPAGYLAGRMAGVDIRKVGSGNVGATNVTRVLGKKFGYPVFAIDFFKGVAAITAAALIANAHRLSPMSVDLCTASAALFAVIGHSYPVWLRFEGGKGFATTIRQCRKSSILCWNASHLDALTRPASNPRGLSR